MKFYIVMKFLENYKKGYVKFLIKLYFKVLYYFILNMNLINNKGIIILKFQMTLDKV